MKKMLLLALAGLFSFPFTAQAQFDWQKTIGTQNGCEIAVQMIEVKTGGYLMLARKVNYQPVLGNDQFYLARTNANGDTLWTKSYTIGGKQFVYPVSVCEDTAGNFYVATNEFDSVATQDANLIKINTQGDTLWTERFNSPLEQETIRNLALGNDGNIIFAVLTAVGNKVIKIAPNRSIVWSKIITYDSTAMGGLNYIQPVNGGYFIFASNYTVFPPIYKTIKIDENGNRQFDKPATRTTPRRVISDSNNNYYLSGSSLTKISPAADTLWSKSFKIGLTTYIGIFASAVTTDGHLIHTGQRYNGMDWDVFLLKTDVHGNVLQDTVLWRWNIEEYAFDIAIAGDGDYIIYGYTQCDLMLLKFRKWIHPRVGTEEQLEKPKLALQVYPNPTTDAINIQSEMPLNGTLILYNLQGQKMLEQTVKHTQTVSLNLQNLPQADYLVQYLSDTGKLITKKIVKQ